MRRMGKRVHSRTLTFHSLRLSNCPLMMPGSSSSTTATGPKCPWKASSRSKRSSQGQSATQRPSSFRTSPACSRNNSEGKRQSSRWKENFLLPFESFRVSLQFPSFQLYDFILDRLLDQSVKLIRLPDEAKDFEVMVWLDKCNINDEIKSEAAKLGVKWPTDVASPPKY